MPEFSLRGIRRMAMKAGAERISKEAMEVLRDLAEDYVLKIIKLALELAEHAKRKTIRKEDVLMAARIINRES